jgi:hypothetical protein
LWDPFTSGTPGNGGASARLLNNGNLVVNDANGNIIWSSNTAQAAVHVQPTLNDARVALQAALGRLAVVETVLNENDPMRAVGNNEANVNVRNLGANAE